MPSRSRRMHMTTQSRPTPDRDSLAATRATVAREDHEGDEAGRCGGCGSRDMILSTEGEHAACVICGRLQEVETRDWPLSQLCNNCAFRKGSDERADPYRWAEITAVVARGQYFHCHKGLPMTIEPGCKSATFSAPDQNNGRVTVCAGWFAARIAYLKQETSTEV